MPKKTKNSGRKRAAKIEPVAASPKVSGAAFWAIVLVASAAAVLVAGWSIKHNIRQLSRGAGQDISGIKEEISKTFESFSENLKGVKSLSGQTVEPVQAFKQNVLEELANIKNESGGQKDTQPGDVAPATTIAAWVDFKSDYGFGLQHPSDWQPRASKVGDWFEVLLSQDGSQDMLKISNLPVNLKYPVEETIREEVGGISFKKVLYKDENKTAHWTVEKGAYKGYYILFPTINAENEQLFGQILETLKFD